MSIVTGPAGRRLCVVDGTTGVRLLTATTTGQQDVEEQGEQEQEEKQEQEQEEQQARTKQKKIKKQE